MPIPIRYLLYPLAIKLPAHTSQLLEVFKQYTNKNRFWNCLLCADFCDWFEYQMQHIVHTLYHIFQNYVSRKVYLNRNEMQI